MGVRTGEFHLLRSQTETKGQYFDDKTDLYSFTHNILKMFLSSYLFPLSFSYTNVCLAFENKIFQ